MDAGFWLRPSRRTAIGSVFTLGRIEQPEEPAAFAFGFGFGFGFTIGFGFTGNLIPSSCRTLGRRLDHDVARRDDDEPPHG